MRMKTPKVLQAFNEESLATARVLLSARVATMMGRKLEEGDWADVYCRSKGIPCTGWSNLRLDVMYGNLGVEHKMLCVGSKKSISAFCGTSRMHPSATRSIRIPEGEKDATVAARDVLKQYADWIGERASRVRENANGAKPDMRTGWLLWQTSLREFLYFEEEMLPPNPDDFYADWSERASGSGTRKRSKNIWVFEKETGKKRFSITNEAGPKIQPYFDVPPSTHPNLYLFTAQGEILADGMIRIWITRSTARFLEQALGSLDTDCVSEAIVAAAQEMPAEASAHGDEDQAAVSLVITAEAYSALNSAFSGVSDEHMVQLVVKHLQAQ